MRSALEPTGLTHVQFVLLASVWWLADHERVAPTQARLAEHAGIDPMMTSQVARKLESRGLIERHIDPADTRARHLRLTGEGRDLLALALTEVEAADEAYFGVLGRQRQGFVDALGTLDAHH